MSNPKKQRFIYIYGRTTEKNRFLFNVNAKWDFF